MPARQPERHRYARHAMEVWREWLVTREERGWPRESSEVRAQQRAQTETVTNGAARWRGKGEPPPMPKETRPAASSRIPDIDRARLGPAVNRLLLDLAAIDAAAARVLQGHYLLASLTTEKRSGYLGVSSRNYWRHVNRGLEWLEMALHRMP